MPRAVQTRPFDSDVLPRLGMGARARVLAHLLGMAGLFSAPVLAQNAGVATLPPVAATQLPTGGQVSAGQASISQSGNTLNVNQTSPRAVVDWNTFNVGKDATVNFQQPNAQSSTLNRVADTQPSQILGRVTATIDKVGLTLMSQGEQALTDITITGDLNVTTGMGGVKGGVEQVEDTTMKIAGASTFTADTKTGQVAKLSSARNIFAGPLSFLTARDGSWSDATVVSSSALIMGATSVTGNLSLTSTGGDITQTQDSPIFVGKETKIVSKGSVTLANLTNNFVGQVNVITDEDLSLTTSDALTLGEVKTKGNTVIKSTGKIDLGISDFGGTLEVKSGGYEIMQSGPGTFGGNTDFDAGTAKIDLFNPFNLWKGSIVYKGGIIMINHPQLLNATNAGTLIVRVETTMATPAQVAKPSPAAGSPAATTAEPAAIPKGTDISISVNRAPSSAQSGLVTVTVSTEIAATGKGFAFALTEHLPLEAAKSTQVSVSQLDGKPLPEWLRYEPATQKVIATSPPPGAFPIQIKANLGGVETVILINEQPK